MRVCRSPFQASVEIVPAPMPETSITIRCAGAADLPNMAVFIEPFVQQGKLLPRTFDELGILVANAFLAESDGKIVGMAALEVYSSKLAEVRSLAVAAEAQGRGVGRRLVEACIERARERNILEVMVITSEDRFFQSCGFEFTLPGEKKALFLKTRDT